jgi:hypothetical protein
MPNYSSDEKKAIAVLVVSSLAGISRQSHIEGIAKCAERAVDLAEHTFNIMKIKGLVPEDIINGQEKNRQEKEESRVQSDTSQSS